MNEGARKSGLTGNPTRGAIYLLSNGEIESDSEQKRYIGCKDWPLNTNGYAMARQWAAWLKNVYFGNIYSSDLQRSLETARIIADGRQIPVHKSKALREIDHGAWEGRIIRLVEQIQPLEFQHHLRDRIGYRPPGGENFRDFYLRIIPFFERIVQKMKHNVLIVSHPEVNRVIICRLMGIPLTNIFRFEQNIGAINIFLPYANSYRLKAFNQNPEWQRRVKEKYRLAS